MKSAKPRRSYPGTDDDNPVHRTLLMLEKMGNIPQPLLPGLLAVMAAIAGLAFTRGSSPPTLSLAPFRLDLGVPPLYAALSVWLFSLGDLVLLNLLPRQRRSYGPPQPATLLMGLLRALVALGLGALSYLGLPLTWAIGLNLAAQIAGSLLAVEGYWFGPQRLGVSVIQLQSNKLNPAAPPLRLLHLSDLHIERLTAREQRLLALIPTLQPDAILFSGDFLNLSYVDDPRAQADCRAFLAQLQAPLGVYAVTGSTPVDTRPAVQAVLQDSPIRRLDNEHVILAKDGQSLELIGVTCTHRPEMDAPSLQTLIEPVKQAVNPHPRFSLLLYHTPDLAPEAAQLGVDLQLSGHTHGGQIRLPLFGALVTSSLYGKRFEMGRYQVGAMTLYVSRGIGMEGKGAPRVRFLCRPEIVLWELGG